MYFVTISELREAIKDLADDVTVVIALNDECTEGSLVQKLRFIENGERQAALFFFPLDKLAKTQD